MAGFEEQYQAVGDDEDFLSANGKTRKEKRAAKKAEKDSKLRAKKGAEISSAVSQSLGGALGIPFAPSVPEKKKGLKGLVANVKNKREQRQADNLYKKDLEKSKKSGTLSTADFPEEKKKRDLSGLKKTVLGLPSLLGLNNSEDETTNIKKADTGKAARYIIIGLGAAALLAILFSKGIPKTSKK